jgi:hypothetical protein
VTESRTRLGCFMRFGECASACYVWCRSWLLACPSWLRRAGNAGQGSRFAPWRMSAFLRPPTPATTAGRCNPMLPPRRFGQPTPRAALRPTESRRLRHETGPSARSRPSAPRCRLSLSSRTSPASSGLVRSIFRSRLLPFSSFIASGSASANSSTAVRRARPKRSRCTECDRAFQRGRCVAAAPGAMNSRAELVRLASANLAHSWRKRCTQS